MPVLNEMRGRVVDLRRHTNVHLYWRSRLGPTERYELWLCDTARCEHQFIIHTRTMPARRGREVTLLVVANVVRGLINRIYGLTNWPQVQRRWWRKKAQRDARRPA